MSIMRDRRNVVRPQPLLLRTFEHLQPLRLFLSPDLQGSKGSKDLEGAGVLDALFYVSLPQMPGNGFYWAPNASGFSTYNTSCLLGPLTARTPIFLRALS